MAETGRHSGYTLIEMILVIIILSILAAVAARMLGSSIDIGRTEETKREMERLAFAIAGNPNLVSAGIRTDFGYVGDVGALPLNWEALIANPGGIAAWKGPYIHDESDGEAGYGFSRDAWGKPYTPPDSSAFFSTGGPEPITRVLAGSREELLWNRVIVTVSDADGTPPGAHYRDSVELILTYPNGIGGLATSINRPDADGLAQFDSIPIGLHHLRAIYRPGSDTLQRKIAVNPGQILYVDIRHFGDIW